MNRHDVLRMYCLLQVSLIYHRKLDDAWKEAAQQLRQALATAPSAKSTPHVVGRSRCGGPRGGWGVGWGRALLGGVEILRFWPAEVAHGVCEEAP